MYHAAELNCEIMCCRAPADTRCCMFRAFLQAFRRQARRQGGSIAGELHEMASMRRGSAVVIAKIAKIARPSPGDSDSRNRECSFQTRPSSRVPTTLELFTTIATMPRAQWHSIAPRPGHSRQALQSQATSDSLQTKCLSNSTRRDATFHTTNTTPHGGNMLGQFSLMPVAEQGISRQRIGPGICQADGLAKRSGWRWIPPSHRQSRHGPVHTRGPQTASANWAGQGVSKYNFDLVTSRIVSSGLWWRPMRAIERTQGSSPSLHVPSISRDPSGADTLWSSSLRLKNTDHCYC